MQWTCEMRNYATALSFLEFQGCWAAQSMVSFNHWLSSIKTNTLSRYWTLVNANHASSNWALSNKNACKLPADFNDHLGA